MSKIPDVFFANHFRSGFEFYFENNFGIMSPHFAEIFSCAFSWPRTVPIFTIAAGMPKS